MIDDDRAEAGLRPSEARFRSLVESLPAAIYTCDASGDVTLFNEAAVALWGRTPELGKDKWCGSFKLYRPDGTPLPLEVCPMALTVKDGRLRSGEEVIVERPDGSRRTIIAWPGPILDASGAIAGAVNILLDVTDSKRALQRSEERFRRYFELGLIGMATTSPEKGILEVNDEICRMLGYERDELLRKSWAELTHPDDLAADVAQFNRVLAGEMNGYSLDKRWIRGDGRVIDTIMAANCSRRADGAVDYFVGLVLDTTERKHALERLRRSEAYLAEGQRLCHTGTWAWNVSRGDLFWSEEHFRIFGLNPETTKPAYEMFFQAVHAEDRSPLRQNFERMVGANADFDAQYRIVRPDGTIRFIHSLAHPVFSAGEVTEYVGTVVDVTERVATEEQIRNLHGELAHLTRLTTVGELAAAIAHEVNQPLGAIVNNASVARDLASAGTKGNRHELNETLSDIVTDANRAAAIIARIRGLMKQTTPKREELQLGDVVKDVVALARRALAENQISVRMDMPDDLPRVSADRVQMQQVLFNLTMNAIEAMSTAHSTRVVTFAGRGEERNGTPAVLVSVSDLGVGFNAEDEERLFEAFYTTKPNGLGMGLRISRSIVEAHGGRLWAQLNSDRGATLFFYLPAESGAPV